MWGRGGGYPRWKARYRDRKKWLEHREWSNMPRETFHSAFPHWLLLHGKICLPLAGKICGSWVIWQPHGALIKLVQLSCQRDQTKEQTAVLLKKIKTAPQKSQEMLPIVMGTTQYTLQPLQLLYRAIYPLSLHHPVPYWK